MLYLVKSFFYFTTLICYSQELFNWPKKAKTFLHSRIKYFILYIPKLYLSTGETKYEKEKKISTNYVAAIIIFICAVVISLGLFLLYVQRSIDTNSQKAMTSNVAKQSDHALSILNIHYGFLNSIADKMGDSSDILSDENMELLVSLAANTDFERTALIEADGTAYYDNGAIKNVAQRKYFLEAMKGQATLSDPLDSSIDQETRVILCVPVRCNDRIIGALGGSYNVTALSQMLFNDIFDDAGYSLIVTKEGEIIAYDGEPSYHKITYGDNFFDFYKDRTLLSKNSLVNVKKDFSAGNDGLIKIRTDSNKKSDQYIAYTRLGMNDWMICYVIPVSDAQSSYSFIKSYEGIFMSVFFILVLLLVFYIIHNNRIRNEELRRDAQTDGLTGVLNKRTTEALINEILEQRPHEKGTFIILDVDKFKEVNDHYGHAVGDIVLSTLGQTLRNYFRENDIIGRIGGDEFVIYMCKTESKERAVTRIRALADTIKNLSFAEMNGHHITISIGIAFAPEHGTCYMDLYKNADTALYETKQNGRDGYFLFQKQDSII